MTGHDTPTPPAVTLLRRLAALLVALLVRLRRRAAPAPERDREDLPTGSRAVLTSDGVRLHVEVDELPGAPVTVVLCHGFTARLEEFDLQRRTLKGRARVVLYDQRGHGRSPRGAARRATIDQLGLDLAAVLDATAPSGPVVLLGHSMGGMTVMAYARRHPEAFGPRVRGVFLLATSAGDLIDAGPAGRLVAALVRLHLLGAYLLALRLWSPLLERVRRRGTTAGRVFTRRYLFGSQDADPELVTLVQQMLEQTPLTVTAAFYATLVAHDETASLAVLGRVPVTVLVGSDDRLTPASHSTLMAGQLGPAAELVVVPGAGHSVNITRPEVVGDALLALLERARADSAA